MDGSKIHFLAEECSMGFQGERDHDRKVCRVCLCIRHGPLCPRAKRLDVLIHEDGMGECDPALRQARPPGLPAGRVEDTRIPFDDYDRRLRWDRNTLSPYLRVRSSSGLGIIRSYPSKPSTSTFTYSLRISRLLATSIHST